MIVRRQLFSLVSLLALVVAGIGLVRPAAGQVSGFPSVGSSFGEAGPYAVVVEATPTHTFFSPSTLGAAGVAHPVVLWGNGTGASPSSYGGLLRHWASHGFIVAAANTPNAGSGTEMLQGLDELSRRNDDPASRFHQRVDTTRVATSGHSQGGFGAVRAARDTRVDTAMPLQGATRVTSGSVSVLFLSGGADTIVSPGAIRNAYLASSAVPAAYGELAGASHFAPAGSGGGYRAVTTAWARWMLMDDPIARSWFIGAGCVLCTSGDWAYESNERLRALAPASATPAPSGGPALLAQLPAVAGERTPEGTLHRMYAALLGRVADPGGLQYWLGRYQQGLDMTSIARHIALSPEFRTTFGLVDHTTFVTLLYQHVFGRAPDPGGLAYWRGLLSGGQASREQVIVHFVESDEMLRLVRAARG